MRTFYLFEVKNNILKDFRSNYNKLYEIFNSIHYLNYKDLEVGLYIFNSITNRLDKDFYNKKIFDSNINSESYICYNYTHTINDFFTNENTKLIIKNSFIKIKTNKSIPSFFYDILNINNIFVCDFDSQDYFLLKDIIYLD